MGNADEIMRLETEFWQAMVDQEPDKAAALLTEPAVSVAMFGIHHFTPAEYVQMAKQGSARIESFRFSDEKVIFPADDVAIASYQVRQRFRMDGKQHDMDCFDTTTWVKVDGRWRAAAHTETPKQSRDAAPA